MTKEEFERALIIFMTEVRKDEGSFNALMAMDSDVFATAMDKFTQALGVNVRNIKP